MGRKSKEEIKKEALRRINKLPKNWRNIRWALRHAVLYDEIQYNEDYLPRGRALNFLSKYNKRWNELGAYAREAGIKLEYRPGASGGRWTSKWVFKGLVKEKKKKRRKR